MGACFSIIDREDVSDPVILSRIPPARHVGRMADEYGSDSEWEIEEVEPHDVERIDVSGPVEAKFAPDIVFKVNNEGDLIDYETGDLAAFTD